MNLRVLACRPLGYSAPVKQRVQADRHGKRMPNVHGPREPGKLHLPKGYADASAPVAEGDVEKLRTTWTEPVETTWEDDSELVWTAMELIGRAMRVQQRIDQLEADARLHKLPAAERAKAYKQLQKNIKKVCKEYGGVKGLPIFHRLKYFRHVSDLAPDNGLHVRVDWT